MPLVSTEWLNNNLNNVKIIDCSWHMPNSKRDGYKEFLNGHIENAIFFDLDKNSNQNTSIPHMLTDKINWEKIRKAGFFKDIVAEDEGLKVLKKDKSTVEKYDNQTTLFEQYEKENDRYRKEKEITRA